MEECDLGVDFDDTFKADNYICLLYRVQIKSLAGWSEISFQKSQMLF